MSDFVSVAVYWPLAAVAVAGALAVVLSREVMRMALGLGAFLLALAGLFAYLGFGFLALAELFVYVGGVLILILFAIMLVHRGQNGSTSLVLRDPFTPAVVSVLTFIALWRVTDGIVAPDAALSGSSGTSAALASTLLGPLLPQFELAGALLLVALVAVVAISGGDRS
ncbi:MAG: NADH-quinone oxidoreductase subunit J [Coriobacteriia bacterium]|nr:NADH-quinone oxidoreductase subunit J [Coriobacteriia bacterium]